MNSALGYVTILDYIYSSNTCGGPFYSRSFGVGICVDHSTTSNIYTYDGTSITNTVFDSLGCTGTVTSTTVLVPGDCTSTPSNNTAQPNPMFSTASYNAILPVYDAAPGVDSFGFSSQSSCSSGGYIQSANWFPLDQCMWFDYYGQYFMFSSCSTQSSAISYSGTVGSVVRTTYTDSACTANPIDSTFSDDCSVPDSTEPVLVESYLTQCSSQCSSSAVSASSSSCDSNSSQVNATLGLTTTIFIMMVVFLFLKAYEVFFKKPTYTKDQSMNSSL